MLCYDAATAIDVIHPQKYMRWSLKTFLQDGKKYIVSGSTDKTLKIWDGAKHRCETTLTSSTRILSLGTYTVNGHNYVACGGGPPNEIEIWNIETHLTQRHVRHTSGLYALHAFEINGKIYLDSGSD